MHSITIMERIGAGVRRVQVPISNAVISPDK